MLQTREIGWRDHTLCLPSVNQLKDREISVLNLALDPEPPNAQRRPSRVAGRNRPAQAELPDECRERLGAGISQPTALRS